MEATSLETHLYVAVEPAMILKKIGFMLHRMIAVAGIVAFVAMIAIVGSIAIPAYVAARASARNRDCCNNLQKLGHLLDVYVQKYGCLPPASERTFLNTLRNAPTAESAVARSRHHLFVCPAKGTKPSPTALDYRYRITPPAELIDCSARIAVPLAADLPRNHLPRLDVNVLLADGSVASIDFAHIQRMMTNVPSEDVLRAIEHMTWLKRECDSSSVLQQIPLQDGR